MCAGLAVAHGASVVSYADSSSHRRAIAEHDFPAGRVTTLLADWGDALSAYAERTTKLVLHRPPLQ